MVKIHWLAAVDKKVQSSFTLSKAETERFSTQLLGLSDAVRYRIFTDDAKMSFCRSDARCRSRELLWSRTNRVELHLVVFFMLNINDALMPYRRVFHSLEKRSWVVEPAKYDPEDKCSGASHQRSCLNTEPKWKQTT